MGEPQIPHTVAEIDDAWLTEALRAQGRARDTNVTALDVEPVGIGFGVMSLLYRLTPTYDEPGAGPESVIAKIAPIHEETRQVARGYDFYRREVEVYRTLGEGTDLRRPACFHADHDPCPTTSCSSSRIWVTAASATSSRAAPSPTPPRP